MSIIEAMRATRQAEDIQDFDLPAIKTKTQKDKIIEIPIGNISPYIDEDGENQPFDIDGEDLNRLVMSISSNGQLEPIKVKQISADKYMVLSGHRRLEAIKKLKKPTIKAEIVNIPTEKEFEYVCNSNIYRLKKSPSSLAKILFGFKKRGKNVTDMAEMFGVNRKTCHRYLNIVNCITDLQELGDKGIITVEAFTALQNLLPDDQITFSRFLKNTTQTAKLTINLKNADMVEDCAFTCSEKGIPFTEDTLFDLFFPQKVDEDNKDESEDKDEEINITIEQLIAIIRDKNKKLCEISAMDIIEKIIDAAESFK